MGNFGPDDLEINTIDSFQSVSSDESLLGLNTMSMHIETHLPVWKRKKRLLHFC